MFRPEPARFQPARLRIVVALVGMLFASPIFAASVDTGQDACYDDSGEIPCPSAGQAFHGQDAQYSGAAPNLILSADGLTVFDANTGLTWKQSADTDGDGDVDHDDKLTWTEFGDYPATLNAASYGGYDDWRRPTIQELYSLIDFRGTDPSGYSGPTSGLVPFLPGVFDFAYGDESAGERVIDAQYWSSTQYVGTVFQGVTAIFGVNFADGRIKGYPRDLGMNGTMTQFALYVRGESYGNNDFVDNGDGTVTDASTGLMWMQNDSGVGMNWEDALAYAESLTFAGHDDWRLPNAKELQGIVDYSRSPSTTGSAAIDPIFSCTPITDEAGDSNYAFYWTGTTHANWTEFPGEYGAYVAFGEALGWFGPPGMEAWIDVHGAGAQRSDPKSGDPADWPYGHGPQGDAIRILNFVRCVRDAGASEVGLLDGSGTGAAGFALYPTQPNPFAAGATVSFSLPTASHVTLAVVDVTGRRVATLIDGQLAAGEHHVPWRAGGLAAGVYFCTLAAGGRQAMVKMLHVR